MGRGLNACTVYAGGACPLMSAIRGFGAVIAPYKSVVMDRCACPMTTWSVFRSVPASICLAANVCRTSWVCSFGRPAALRARSHGARHVSFVQGPDWT